MWGIKANWFERKINCNQSKSTPNLTSSWWPLFDRQRNSNHLRSHLTAVIALDNSRLGLENKFLESKSGRIFLRLTRLLTIWGRVNQPFILFIHHFWGETVLWGAVFIIQTSYRMQCFTILKYKLHPFNIQDDQSTRGLLAKALKKLPKSPI